MLIEMNVAELPGVEDVKASHSDGRATVMAEPIVTTQNNLQAEIDFYTEIPYFSATVTYNEFGNRTVDYSTGGGTGGANGGGNMIYLNNSLTVTPRINGDDSITMECYPEIDQQVGTVTGPNGESMPITSNWYIYVPQVTVADGETLALGGMINKTEDENYRSTPLRDPDPWRTLPLEDQDHQQQRGPHLRDAAHRAHDPA